MSLILNERLKLIANGLNSLAVALVAGGSLGPIAAWLYGTAHFALDVGYLFAASIFCFLAAFILHCIGLAILGRLQP
jgi:hypothetical protein